MTQSTMPPPATGPTVWRSTSLPDEAWSFTTAGTSLDSELVRSLHGALYAGPGFARVGGLDLGGLDDTECLGLSQHLGSHFGTPRPLATHRRADNTLTPGGSGRTGRSGRTPSDTAGTAPADHADLALHTDRSNGTGPAEILALLCVRQALTGGDTLLASGPTIHNDLLDRCPDALVQLYATYDFGEVDGHTRRHPVFAQAAGRVTVAYNRYQIRKRHQEIGRPLTPVQEAAFESFDRVLNQPGVTFCFLLHPGDLLLVHNATVLHGRTAFSLGDPAAGHRYLTRTWIDPQTLTEMFLPPGLPDSHR